MSKVIALLNIQDVGHIEVLDNNIVRPTSLGYNLSPEEIQQINSAARFLVAENGAARSATTDRGHTVRLIDLNK